MTIIGIDLGGTKTSMCIGDRQGDIRDSKRFMTHAERGPDVCLNEVVEEVRALIQKNDVSTDDVEAIGISSPGPVSVKRKIMLAPPNMTEWVDVPLVDIFEKTFNRPTFMNNDANACALAEFMFGEYKGVKDLVYLTMSTGLGAGVIANGEVLQGASDTAGEIGHHVLDINGPDCPCGQKGCLELYCGGKNVADRIRAKIVTEQLASKILDHADGDPDKIDFRCFAQAVDEGDALALSFWEEYLERLAQGIGTVIMFFNPEVIVLGTIGIHLGDRLIQPLHKRLPSYCWNMGREACRIVPSALGPKIGDLSALAVAIDNME